MNPPGDTLNILKQPASAATALAVLGPAAARWFVDRFGTPTMAQCLAWPIVAGGRHLLLSAPTGTGKTLAALLPLLCPAAGRDEDRPAPWGLGSGIRGLLLAPLTALVNDAARNLDTSLEGLAAYQPGSATRPRWAVRTGDTPPEERRLLRSEPPDILLTTPESLAVLLAQPELAAIFRTLAWVVVDEIHALAGSKRGADLAVSLERLDLLAAGPVQRLGLSATATPLETAARWLVGMGRGCAIASVPASAGLHLRIDPLSPQSSFLTGLTSRLQPELRAHASTLVFTNTRALAERLAWSLRRDMPDWDDLIGVHHSALAAERRRDIEERCKRGELRAVVSSTSLELGIDIGAVDLVVLVHPPGDVVRLLQRVGRSGHGPGRFRQGLVLTASPAELLEATVTAASGLADQCEPLLVPCCPLDVLCQQILGMASAGECSADDAYDLVRRSAPFADLARRDFDDCVAYLFGLDVDGLNWLPARLYGDGNGFRIRDRATARLVLRNLGTIVAEPRHEVLLLPADSSADDAGTPVGTLDQTFAERLQPGDRFLLDGRCLQVRRRSGSQVEVEQVVGRPAVPRWGNDGWPLSPELARRLYLLRLQAAETLRDGPDALAAWLRRDHGLEAEAVGLLAAYFEQQETRSEIPDLSTCLIEVVTQDEGDALYIHTTLNRKGNDALARVAVRRLVRDFGRATRSVVADLGLILFLRGTLPADLEPPLLVRRLLAREQLDVDLEEALAEAGVVRERFARVALTGLMLLRNPAGGRRRVGGAAWGEARLYEEVRVRAPDFVLLRQAAREVRADWCDAGAALDFAERLPTLTIHCRRLARPSPFAEHWTQTMVGPAEEVETAEEALRRLHFMLTGTTEDSPESRG
jgi:ATP-dependent Lhr-like helicase